MTQCAQSTSVNCFGEGGLKVLSAQGLEQERRALRIAILDLQESIKNGWLMLPFDLARGQFATAALREWCELADAAVLDAEME